MYKTAQEQFWQGNFGNEYSDRNRGISWVTSNISFFSRILNRTRGIDSFLELGSNIGLNLMALRQLAPSAKLSAIEINERAAEELKINVPGVDLHLGSILEFKANETWDFVFTKGVLIHINPNMLNKVYETIYTASSRYIMLSEYYNPSPVIVNYRGHDERLFKRDFAGEMMSQYPDLSLVDYGFVYHRDPNFPQDDMTWFLLKK